MKKKTTAKRGSRKKEDPAADNRDRTTLIFAPAARQALTELQTFLIGEARVKSSNASMATHIALVYAAENLAQDKERFLELVEQRKQEDGRKKAS